jgi:lysophospholipase L1-like esterase
VNRSLLRAAGALLAVVGAPLVFLAFLELIAWAWGAEPLTESHIHGTRDYVRSCRWNPADYRRVCDPARWKRSAHGKKLVLAFGGSSVVGFPFGDSETFAMFLRLQLGSAQPGAYSVRSLARPCKGSFYVSQCAMKALAASPAALVVYSGHNDFSGHRGRFPELPIWMERSGWWLIEIERQLARTRFWSLLSPFGRLPITAKNDPGASLSEADVVRMNRVILENFVRNVSELITAAEERGVPVLLVTVVSNLYEFPYPHDRWEEAIEQSSAPGGESQPGLADFVQGTRLFRDSRFDEALRAFRRARDARPGPRAPGMLNDAIREIAPLHANAHLVDIERQLESLAGTEGIGCNFFGTEAYCDGVHPNPRTNRLIGFAAADAVLEITSESRSEPRRRQNHE